MTSLGLGIPSKGIQTLLGPELGPKMPKMAKIQENVARGCVRMRDIIPHIAL